MLLISKLCLARVRHSVPFFCFIAAMVAIVVFSLSPSAIYALVITPPKKLRDPITTWITPEFNLRSAFNDQSFATAAEKMRPRDASDAHKVLRYVNLYEDGHAPEEDDHHHDHHHDGDGHGHDHDHDHHHHLIRGPTRRTTRDDKDNPANPFWSGVGANDPRLIIEYTRELADSTHPNHEGNLAHDGVSPVQQMQVVLNAHAWGVPCWRAVLRKINMETTEWNEIIAQSEIICHEPTVRGHYVTVPLPGIDVLMSSWATDAKTLWRVSAEFEQPEITTFSLLAPTGLGADVMKTGAKYDVVPQNATMGFKFMIQVNGDASKPDENGEPGGEYFEMWAFRKPPIPDFRLSLFIDGENVFSEPIHDIQPTSHAYGVKHRMQEHSVVNFTGRHVAMYAVFVEPRRQFVASVRVINLAKHVHKALFVDPIPEGRNYHEAVIEAQSDELKEILGITEPVKVILRRYPHANMVGLYVDFIVPHVQNTLVTFWALSKEVFFAGDRKRGHVFLRETDFAVPPRSELDHHAYGWDDALPVAGDADNNKRYMKRLHHVMEDDFDIEVQFDLHHTINIDEFKKDHEERQRPLAAQTDAEKNSRGRPRLSKNKVVPLSSVVESWLHMQGGRCNNLDLTFLDVPHHSHAKPHPLKLTAAVPKFVRGKTYIDSPASVLAAVPFYALFSASLATKTGWASIIAQHEKSLRDFIANERLDPSALDFLYLTLGTMSHVYDGSHNFRPLFRLFEESAVNLPPLYHTEELALFSFSAAFHFERKRMLALWEEEYSVVSRCASKLKREITRDMYFFHRSQVEARAINGTSGEMELVPVIDCAPHSDEPTAEIIFDARSALIALVPLRDLEVGDEATINYGTTLPGSTAAGAGKKKVRKTAIGFLLQHGVVPRAAEKSVSFVESSPSSAEQRSFTLIAQRPQTMEPYLELLRMGHEKFFSQHQDPDDAMKSSDHEQEAPPDLAAATERAREKLQQIVKDKLASMPTTIPQVSDDALIAAENAKMEKAKARLEKDHADQANHQKHFASHRAHHPRDISHLRPSYDAAREQAQALLEAEREALQYFVDLLSSKSS